MSYEDVSVDLSTARKAEDSVREIQDRVRGLHKRAETTEAEIRAEVEKLAGEFKASIRVLNESHAQMSRPSATHGSDVEINRYLPIEADDIGSAKKGLYLANKEGAVQIVGRAFPDGSFAPGLLDDIPRTEWQAELQRVVSQRGLVRACQARGHTPGLDRQIARLLRTAPAPVRKIFADSTGIGAEWIPDNWSSTLERDIQAPRPISALFQEMVVPPGGTFHLPYQSGGLTPYVAGAVTADDPAKYRKSSISTAERTVDTKKFVVAVQIDEDASEDSLIAVEPELRAEIARAFADAFEDAKINGDIAGTRDTALGTWNPRNRWDTSALGTTADHRRAFDGLREVALDAAQANNANDRSGAITATGLREDIKTLEAAHWLNGASGIAILPTPEYYLGTMLGWTEVITVDKAGGLATFQTGQLASAWGHPIHLSEFVTADMNASGIYDGATTSLGSMIVVSTARFRRFRRRGQRVRLAADITRGVVNMVADTRYLFKKISPLDEKNVHLAYNLPT